MRHALRGRYARIYGVGHDLPVRVAAQDSPAGGYIKSPNGRVANRNTCSNRCRSCRQAAELEVVVGMNRLLDELLALAGG